MDYERNIDSILAMNRYIVEFKMKNPNNEAKIDILRRFLTDRIGNAINDKVTLLVDSNNQPNK